MADHITTRIHPGTWVLRAGDAVLGESRSAVELVEGGDRPVIYFPRGDIAMAFFEPSSRRSRCPWKGEAVYFSIATPGTTIRDAAWSYEDPPENLAAIKDHLAFYTDRVTVEMV